MSHGGKYTKVEMDEKKSKKGTDDLELPFDEEFWSKVSVCFDYRRLQMCLKQIL